MIAVVVLVVLNLMILQSMHGKKGAGDWTVYGTMGCGWTRKQLEHMKKKGIAHTFVDCEGGACPGMDAFPTMVHKNGEKIVGFKEV